MRQATELDHALLKQQMEEDKQLSVQAIECLINASIAMAKPHVDRYEDLQGVLEGIKFAWSQTANKLMILSIFLQSLRYLKPDEIVLTVDRVNKALQDDKIDQLMQFKYTGMMQ